MSKVDIKSLFESGAHFGHKTSRWHPKMASYIHSSRGGTHIIDLTKTVELLEQASHFLEKTAAQGKQILLVGTKRQANEVIKKAAEETKMPYVNNRWIGGTLTNATTINGRIKHLKDLEQKMASGAMESRYNKLELQRFTEEIDELNERYGGIKEMTSMPSAVVVCDVKHDNNAVLEARKLQIPLIAIVDSNVDPSDIDYPIPANDDAIKSIEVIVGALSDAINRGKTKTKTPEKAKKEDS